MVLVNIFELNEIDESRLGGWRWDCGSHGSLGDVGEEG